MYIFAFLLGWGAIRDPLVHLAGSFLSGTSADPPLSGNDHYTAVVVMKTVIPSQPFMH